MIILGPSVLLMVKMCISRRQNMMKSRERTMRPGYSAAGISLQTSPAMNSRMAATSSLFQKSLKYSTATFTSPHSPGS